MLKKRIRYHRYQTLLLLLIMILICSCAAGLKTKTAIDGSERFNDEINTFIQWDKKNSFPQDAILFVGSSTQTEFKPLAIMVGDVGRKCKDKGICRN